MTQTYHVPDSGHIHSFTYDPDARTLSVQFRGRQKAYKHVGVPSELFDSWRDWTQAGYSPGKFYHSHVKGYALDSDVTIKPK